MKSLRRAIGTAVLSLCLSQACISQDLDWEKSDGPYGGTVVSISKINDSHVFAGTTKGLYHSIDNGNSWDYLSSLASVTGIVPIHDLLIASTTNRGIYRSEDGGLTWSDTGFEHILVPAMVKSKSGAILAATAGYRLVVGGVRHYGGIYRTTDALNWEEVTGKSENNIVWDIVADTAGSIYASTNTSTQGGDLNAVLVSNDDGSTWDTLFTSISPRLSEEPDYGFAIHSNAAGTLLFANENQIWRSGDGGESWTLASDSLDQWIRGDTLSNGVELSAFIYDLDKDTHGTYYAGMVGGTPSPLEQGRIYASFDDGVTWQTHAEEIGALALEPISDGLLAGRLFDGIARLKDGIWSESNSGLSAVPLRLVTTFSNDTLFVASSEPFSYALSKGRAFQSVDGGASWNPILIDDAGYVDFVQGPTGTMYAATVESLFRSGDGGFTWKEIPTEPLGVDAIPRNIGAVHVGSDGYVYLGTRSAYPTDSTGAIYRSSDQGITWEEVESDIQAVTDFAIGKARLHAATFGVLSRKDDDEWIKTLDSDLIHQLERNQLGTLYALSSDSLYVSVDDGSVWHSHALPTTNPATLAISSANQILVSSSDGTYISPTGGESWLPFSEEIFAASFLPDDRLVAVRPDGVFTTVTPVELDAESSPKPPSFITLENPFPNPIHSAATIEFRLARQTTVRIEVFDVLGRTVSLLLDELRNPGSHRVTWNAAKLAGGTYYLRMQADDHTRVKPIVVLP